MLRIDLSPRPPIIKMLMRLPSCHGADQVCAIQDDSRRGQKVEAKLHATSFFHTSCLMIISNKKTKTKTPKQIDTSEGCNACDRKETRHN